MAIKILSEEWILALMHELNNSQAYREAAKNWEGDFYFILEPDVNIKEKVIYYMDLWHGKCRSACIVTDEKETNPAFGISASISIWRRVIEKKLDPIQGMVTRQLNLQGNLMKIMKAPKAAMELVNCCTRVPTEFPD